jgi:PAS domain-containing protein
MVRLFLFVSSHIILRGAKSFYLVDFIDDQRGDLTSESTVTYEAHHEELVSGLANQMKQIIDASQQPIFIYLDDNHKACNQRFASFLGYKSPDEWAKIPGFLEVYVEEKSRSTLMNAYWNAANNMNASTINLTWQKKDGAKIASTMILVPMAYEGHILSVHFITSAQ